MTREEAKEILTHNWTRVDNPNYSESELDEAFFMAIEALYHHTEKTDNISTKVKSDLISRADAIEAVHKYFVDKINNEPHEIDEDGDDVFTDMKSVNALFHHNKMVSKAIKALPSADAVDVNDVTIHYKPYPSADAVSHEEVIKALDLQRERHNREKADMIRVVRCKDCRYCEECYDTDGYPYWICNEWDGGTDADGYCHYGQRREP